MFPPLRADATSARYRCSSRFPYSRRCRYRFRAFRETRFSRVTAAADPVDMAQLFAQVRCDVRDHRMWHSHFLNGPKQVNITSPDILMPAGPRFDPAIGAWVLTRHVDVLTALREPRFTANGARSGGE